MTALGGGGRIPVKATFDGIDYRGSVVRMGGCMCIGVRQDILTGLGKDAGDQIEVSLERDDAPRTVEVPVDLARAMSAAQRKAWDALSYTKRKELARSIEDAKKPETRARRVASALDSLRS